MGTPTLKRLVVATGLAGLFIAGAVSGARAQQPASSGQQAPGPSGWTFNIAPYLWLPTVNATLNDNLPPVRGGRERTCTKAIAREIRIVHTAGPYTLLLQMQLVGVESSAPVISTVTRLYPAGLVLNITRRASSVPGTFSGSVIYAMMLYDSANHTLLAAAENKKYPVALAIGSTLSTRSRPASIRMRLWSAPRSSCCARARRGRDRSERTASLTAT